MDQKRLSAALAALAQPTRLAAMTLLLDAGSAGLPASSIASGTGCEPSNMSVHLRVLAMAGLVDSERTGRQIIYTAHAAIVEDVLASLAERLPTTPKPRRRLSIKASS